MNLLLFLLPLALYLMMLMAFDSFKLTKWKFLLACVGYGALCCSGAFFLTRAVDVSGWAVPMLEEFLKVCAVLFLISGSRIRFLHEALVYGAAAGAGFSLLENIIYLSLQPEMLAGTALIRGFGCAVLHIGCTALAGTLLLLLKNTKIPLPVSAVLSLIPSILIHLAYNLAQENNIVNPLLLMSVTIVLFLSCFPVLFSYGERRIYKWMDHSLSVDVQTLSAIRDGNFASTNAGKYLLDIRDRFKPECFFDMVCFVQLSLELDIEKQSYMLLRQAGFAGEATGGTLEGHLAKKAELETLRKRIGRTGLQVLSPMFQNLGNRFFLKKSI